MIDVHCVRTFQGANSATFRHPPLDGSLTVPEVFAHHAQHSPEHPLFVYADGPNKTRTICYPEAYRAIRKSAAIITNHYKRSEDVYVQRQRTRDSATPPVYGILATADTISYITLIIGIMHSGITPFPISTRNSVAGVAHLLRQTSTYHLFVSTDYAMQHLGHEAAKVLAEEGIETEILPIPHFSDFYNENSEPEGIELVRVKAEATAIILHSSGSTAQPKPIKLTNHRYFLWGLCPYFGEVDICNRPIALHSLPMFHAMGANSIVWTISAGNIVACFKPSTPPIIPTPDSFFEGIVATRCQIVYCVPAFIEAWSRFPEKIEIMRTFKAIIYSGAPLNQTVGDYLAGAGVALVASYGMTEVGTLSIFVPNPPQADEWQYFKLSPRLQVEMLPRDGPDNTFEPLVLVAPLSHPNVLNTVFQGKDGYITNDLLQRHPTKPNLYKIYGRVDDQLMLSTGEKTNPVPLESILSRDSHIAAALIFGRGRFQNGVLIQPKDPFDPSDQRQLVEFKNKIWPSVEMTNEYAPAHSRIFKEMIIITNPSKPLEFTPKGMPRRQFCIDIYAKEIDTAYHAVKESSQMDLEVPDVWTPGSALDFVRKTVGAVMSTSLSDDDDLFQHGCDSLQATWIRNTIMRALRTSVTFTLHQLPHSFVYSNPTIAMLSDLLLSQFSSDNTANGKADLESRVTLKVEEMEALVRKLGHNLPIPSWQAERTSFDTVGYKTVLLTGSTGRFGCHILSKLVQDPTVTKIFALNRESDRSDATLEARQREAFKRWGLLDAVLPVLDKAEFVACDLADPQLGLAEERYRGIQNSVTTIIHNAWHVDFNLSLSSFGPLLMSVRNLIDLALSSPLPRGPHLLLVSSIAVLRNHSSPHPVAEAPVDSRTAVGAGYGESKWVAERLLMRTARERGLSTTVVRVGQLSGDTRIGGWGPKEWVPALIGAGKAFGCIPKKDVTISWIPVDVAASVLLDMSFSSSDQRDRTLHLVSPRPVDWNTIFGAVAGRLGVPLVPYPKWLAVLKQSSDDDNALASPPKYGAASSLLGFFEEADFGEVRMSLEKSLQVSQVLAQVPPLGSDDALRYLDFWNALGYIEY